MEQAIMDTANVEQAIKEESSLGPGTYDIRFYLADPVGGDELKSIASHLSAEGVDVISVSQKKVGGLWTLSVKYRKPAESEAISALPLAIIPLIAFGFIVVLVGIGIFKIDQITNNIGKILLVTFGGLTLFALAMRKPIETVATAYAGRR